jgi:hypothetical protein
VLRNIFSFQSFSLVAAYPAKIHRFPGDVRHAKSTVFARYHSHHTARRAEGLFKTITLRA